MADMTDPYVNIIVTTRTPERAAAILDMLDVMIDDEYIGPLEQSLNVNRDDPSNCAMEVERILARTFVRFVGRMSISLSEEGVYQHPRTAVALYLLLSETLDNVEDPDTLLNLALAEEEPGYILQTLLQQVSGDPSYLVAEVVELVQPVVIDAIRNVLTARVIDEEPATEGNSRRARLAAYLREFPDNPDGWLYLESPITIAPSVFIGQLKPMEDEKRFVIIHTVGLTVFYNSDAETAYKNIERYFDLLNTNGLDRFELLALIAPVVQSVFDMSADAAAAIVAVEGIENES